LRTIWKLMTQITANHRGMLWHVLHLWNKICSFLIVVVRSVPCCCYLVRWRVVTDILIGKCLVKTSVFIRFRFCCRMVGCASYNVLVESSEFPNFMIALGTNIFVYEVAY
jgi:hypothetical protein